jgi:D-glycero-D-manno-heptose 1,7-bisphosphate phosphatase
MEASPQKAVFLDKDGTLIHDVPYNVDPAKITLASGAMEGLQRIQEMGYLLIVVTNQAGIAKGYFSEEALTGVQLKISELLSAAKVRLDGFYYCPHHPEGSVAPYSRACACRKPMPGLLWQAAKDFHVDLSRSWMIGDILNDVEAGKRAGCRTILIDNGNETEWRLNQFRTPDYRLADLCEAAFRICLEKQ